MAGKNAGKRVIVRNFTGEVSAIEAGIRIVKMAAGVSERGLVSHETAGERQSGDLRTGKQR